MALFGRVRECVTTPNSASFVALIEVRSRKNGQPRFIVYKVFCGLLVSDNETTEELHEYIFAEYIDIEEARRHFFGSRHGIINYHPRPAPHGFYRFMRRAGLFSRDKPDATFHFFPRWNQRGKKIGRRQKPKVSKPLKLELGNLHSIIAVKQRELASMQRDYDLRSSGLDVNELRELELKIDQLIQELKVARKELSYQSRPQPA